MGIAFFMMSYVTLIPPLDGLVLNYKKLDRWKEQKHFRVQLEAQRIFEQQLQQEQNLARVNPVHHANAMTIHAHHAHLALGLGSPKLQRTFGAGVGSANFGGAGHLAAMFSPPMSQPEHDFPHHQLQSRLHGSTTNFVIQASHEYLPGSTRQHDVTSSKERAGRRGRDVDTLQQNFQQTERGRKVPPIVTSGLNDGPRLGLQAQNYILSPPLMRRQSITSSSPGSPALQYLPVGDDYSQDDNKPTIAPGSKTEWVDEDEKWAGSTGGDRILKTAPHQYNDPTTRSGHPTLPLRTTNKPTPPHDPFRKTSISSSHSTISTVTPVQDTPMTVTKGYKSPPNQGNKTGYQSLYQPPEPTRTQDKYPLQQHPPYCYSDPTKVRPTNIGGLARYEERDIALTATGRILSSIGGMSGCYGIVGGLPSPSLTSTGVPSPSSTSISKQQPYFTRLQLQEEPSTQQPNQSKSRQKKSAHSTQQQQKQDPLPRIPETDYRQDGPFPPVTLDMAPSGPTRSSETPYAKNHRASVSSVDYSMPDIVLTLPTPAEHGHGSRRDEYFGM